MPFASGSGGGGGGGGSSGGGTGGGDTGGGGTSGGDIGNPVAGAGTGAAAGSAAGPWGAIIGGALGLLGNAYATYSTNQAANKKPKFLQQPLPPYQEAINRITARALALNMMQQGPSFQDFVGSGGTARFNMINPGMTPKAMRDLGIVSPVGGRVPFGYAGSGQRVGDTPLGTEGQLGELSPTQELYLGYQTRGQAGYPTKAFKAHQVQKQLAARLALVQARSDAATDPRKVKKLERQADVLQRKAARQRMKEIIALGHRLPGEQQFDSESDFVMPWAGDQWNRESQALLAANNYGRGKKGKR